MQTIRSRFLTIICGVSLTLSMVFGALAVILVDHDETIIAARTLNGQAAHVYTTLNPIFIQSEDIVHYIGNTIEHEVKDPQELRDKRIGTAWKTRSGGLFIMPSAVSTAFRVIISTTMKIYPVRPTASGMPAAIRATILRFSRLRRSKPMEKKP